MAALVVTLGNRRDCGGSAVAYGAQLLSRCITTRMARALLFGQRLRINISRRRRAVFPSAGSAARSGRDRCAVSPCGSHVVSVAIVTRHRQAVGLRRQQESPVVSVVELMNRSSQRRLAEALPQSPGARWLCGLAPREHDRFQSRHGTARRPGPGPAILPTAIRSSARTSWPAIPRVSGTSAGRAMRRFRGSRPTSVSIAGRRSASRSSTPPRTTASISTGWATTAAWARARWRR